MIISEGELLSNKKGEEAYEFFLLENIKSILSEAAGRVFVSHKHGEVELVYRLRQLLSRHGFEGYVDWEDDQLPKQVSGETASKIKEQFKKADKFILIANEAAIHSPWCNWELGYGDACKYNQLALFPVRKNNSIYSGTEYLQIYPSIQVETMQERITDIYVLYPDKNRAPLKDWLA